jgi:stearoyl-CoA desaturase (Delta-9 desaturase)
MQLKRLRETQDGLLWPQESTDLPVISWQSCEPELKPTLDLN